MRGVSLAWGPMLSWGSVLFRALCQPTWRRRFRRHSSRELPRSVLPLTHMEMGAVGWTGRRLSGVSLGWLADEAALAVPSTLLRFSTSSRFSGVRNPSQPWLMVSPEAPSHVAALRGPPSG